MRKIRKGDQVIVLTGKDNGKKGTIISMISDQLVIVEGINISKKHQKPSPMKGLQGGIVDKNMPLHISNLALFNPTTNRPDKVGFKLLADGRKVRFFKSNNEIIDV